MGQRLPELVRNYSKYSSLMDASKQTGSVDLSRITWIYPTTFLPLICEFVRDQSLDMKLPEDQKVRDYISTLIQRRPGQDCCATYLPYSTFPVDKKHFDPIMDHICDLAGEVDKTGNFRYILGELSDNVYQHSKFNFAAATAQKYPSKGFMEFCILDDGITIGGSLRDVGYEYDDTEAIDQALNGLSSKISIERGYGLGESIEYFINEQKGEVFIASGNGGLYMSGNEREPLKFILKEKYCGTLISARIELH